MQSAPKGLRLHIGLYGRRNVGKSSLLNAVTGQDVAIVSDVAGTTTDPVEKAMELLPIGPVLFIDTAGIDDVGALGQQRIDKTHRAIARTEVAVLVVEAGTWGAFEDDLLAAFDAASLPTIVVFNKVDLGRPDAQQVEALRAAGRQVLAMEARAGEGASVFKQALLAVIPESFLESPPIVGDLVQPAELVVLVVPVDLEAPKGRLILPQVQTIRDLLDSDACCAVVKDQELPLLLDNLKRPPALIVTDSQAFDEVGRMTPEGVPLTSFSILFARLKGDLPSFVEGAMAIDRLQPGDRLLVAEACTHHPIGGDIGREKIPDWLNQYVGGELAFDVVSGQDFPDDLTPYKLVVHCGSCTFNRRHLLSRIVQCRQAGVPITNYGVAIAFSLGMLKRALGPFPEALARLDGVRAIEE